MLRRTETVTVGLHNLHVTALDWTPLLEHKISGVYGLVPKESTTWQTGRLIRSAFELWNDAVAQFRAMGPQIDAIKTNADLNSQGRKRMALQLIDPMVTAFETQVTKMNESIETLTTTAQESMSPVKPLLDNDVVGYLRDQEIRQYLRDTADQKLYQQMLKGKHPILTAAALRAASYVLTGYPELDVQRLEKAGIAAAHGEDIEMLENMAIAFDDARVTALRVTESLARIVDVIPQGEPLYKRVHALFEPNADLASFREWLNSIPRPAKRYEPIVERKKPQSGAADAVAA